LNNCFRDALAKIVAFAAGVLLQTLSSATFMFASGLKAAVDHHRTYPVKIISDLMFPRRVPSRQDLALWIMCNSRRGSFVGTVYFQ
jgi:hypothetical protein